MVWVFGVFLVGCEKSFWFSSLSLTGNTNLQKPKLIRFMFVFLFRLSLHKNMLFLSKDNYNMNIKIRRNYPNS